MSRYLDGQSVAGFSLNLPFAPLALFDRVAGTMRIWRKRYRERQELLDYLAMDHRVGTDIGLDRGCAREWAQRPFWRA